MKPIAAAFLLSCAALGGAALTPKPAAAQVLVIEAAAAGLSAGEMIAEGASVTLAAGETATVMTAAGEMMTLEGPRDGPLDAAGGGAGLLGAVESVMARRSMTRTLGATRGGAASAGEGPVLDLLSTQTFCLEGGRAPDLALPARPEDRILRLSAQGAGAAEVVWPADASRVPWPTGLPAGAGRTYRAEVGGLAVGGFTLRAAPAAAGAPLGARIVALDEAGCAAQAEEALARLMR